jgi:hypothetical protein
MVGLFQPEVPTLTNIESDEQTGFIVGICVAQNPCETKTD